MPKIYLFPIVRVWRYSGEITVPVAPFTKSDNFSTDVTELYEKGQKLEGTDCTAERNSPVIKRFFRTMLTPTKEGGSLVG